MQLEWVLPGFTGFYRVLPSFTEFYRVFNTVITDLCRDFDAEGPGDALRGWWGGGGGGNRGVGRSIRKKKRKKKCRLSGRRNDVDRKFDATRLSYRVFFLPSFVFFFLKSLILFFTFPANFDGNSSVDIPVLLLLSFFFFLG